CLRQIVPTGVRALILGRARRVGVLAYLVERQGRALAGWQGKHAADLPTTRVRERRCAALRLATSSGDAPMGAPQRTAGVDGLPMLGTAEALRLRLPAHDRGTRRPSCRLPDA